MPSIAVLLEAICPVCSIMNSCRRSLLFPYFSVPTMIVRQDRSLSYWFLLCVSPRVLSNCLCDSRSSIHLSPVRYVAEHFLSFEPTLQVLCSLISMALVSDPSASRRRHVLVFLLLFKIPWYSTMLMTQRSCPSRNDLGGSNGPSFVMSQSTVDCFLSGNNSMIRLQRTNASRLALVPSVATCWRR